jgi:hypothetical protein
MVLEVFQLLVALEGAVAHRRDDFQSRRQGAQGHLEAHLIVAGGRATMRHHLGAKPQGDLRDGLRLQHALRAHAERIHTAAPHVAHDQELEHLIEVGGAGVDQVMLDGAELGRTERQRLRGLGIDAPGVDGDRNHRPVVGILEPWHAERGVQAPRKCQQNRRIAFG